MLSPRKRLSASVPPVGEVPIDVGLKTIFFSAALFTNFRKVAKGSSES